MATTKNQNPEVEKGRLPSYNVPKGEEDVFHVELERTQFDHEGTKQSIPFVQKYDRRTWEMVKRNLAQLGYNYVNVLHDPTTEKKTRAASAKAAEK